MVVTVEVELCSSVFFPGDPLYCRIIVTNSLNPKNPDSLENTDVSSSENSTPINTPTKSSYIQKDTPPRASVTIDQSNSNKSHTSHSGEDNDLKTELLSWISLQIHGNMLVDPLYVKVSNLPQPASSKAHTPRTALAVGSISSANMASTSLPNLSDLGMLHKPYSFTSLLTFASQILCALISSFHISWHVLRSHFQQEIMVEAYLLHHPLYWHVSSNFFQISAKHVCYCKRVEWRE